VSDTAPEYIIRKKEVVDFASTYPNCVKWFYTSFYDKLFEKHPNFQPMFKKDMESQGRMLSGMVTSCIDWMGKDDETLHETLVRLVRRHAEFGVQAHMYGEMLDVLFWCLNHCLGTDTFTSEVSTSWAKVRWVSLTYYK
jgi:hemoglobin-like flavoprotein